MMRVLLVDDEEELVSALAERMSFRGIQADWVTSGEAALAKAQGESYELAVLDMKMPRMGGLEVMRELRRLRPDMRFIFLTGHGSEKDFQAGAAEAGETFYLVKPVSIDVLIAKMREALGGKQAPA